SVDAIVLATGDGDFIPLIEYLRSNGKQIEVISFGRSSSGKLREAADEFIDLGDDLNKYLIKNKRIFKKIRSQTKDSRERK
ncbi:MAG TPA: NYN domain-containing protein, partial [Candidatus Paceibacterota bacterium]|nr:NYN domain-containing protein [Candidatus Paceibacterota bacterium]